MSGSLTVVIPPTYEPVSVEEVFAHTRISDTADIAQVLQFIKAARELVEGYTWRTLIATTYDWRLDQFPALLCPPRSPVTSVTEIVYLDSAGASQTLSASDYQTDIYSAPARILPAPGLTWPTTELERLNAVRVRFVAGYSAPTAVPKDLRTALLMLVDDMYEHRSRGTELRVEDNPTVQALLWPHRVWQ